jgi:hypothetical protein
MIVTGHTDQPQSLELLMGRLFDRLRALYDLYQTIRLNLASGTNGAQIVSPNHLRL